MDLIFGWSIKFWGKVSVGDKKIGLKFWLGVKISGVLFVGEKFRHPLRIFVTFPRHFFPDKVTASFVWFFIDVVVLEEI